MLYIVHGDDIAKSRNLILNQQKKLNCESRTELSLAQSTPNEIFDLTHKTDIFGERPFIVLNITVVAADEAEKFVGVLAKAPAEAVVILFAEKSLPKTNAFIKNLHAAKILAVDKKPDSNIFSFIDALFAKNRQRTYKELERLHAEDIDDFYMFSMILYGLRNVAGAKFGSTHFKSSSGFVQKKSQDQAALFSETGLKQLFNELYKLDKAAKTGDIHQDMLVPTTIEKVLNS